jgi:hypothetical protein
LYISPLPRRPAHAVFLCRLLADAVERGDDLTAAGLLRLADLALNGGEL